MSKYAPLKAFLMEQDKDLVPMTFAEIEGVLSLQLPPSKRYPAWWSNNPSNNTMTREWLDAGFETESVDVAAEKLVFRRVGQQHGRKASSYGGLREAPAAFSGSRPHPGFGFMKGLLTIEDGYDVTKPPSDEAWDAGYLGFEGRK